MSAIKAKNNYIGQGGCKRMNCAQSVLSAFKDKFDIEDGLVEAFQSFGGGRAPNGLCGAYYAVKYIVNKQQDEEKGVELEQYFLEQAGALECSNIKGLKKLSCVGCIEKSSEFLEKLG
ncbi:MAG TPA: C-GCAxxG-C-C family (seleno)protein [Ruminiclostridium sp.]